MMLTAGKSHHQTYRSPNKPSVYSDCMFDYRCVGFTVVDIFNWKFQCSKKWINICWCLTFSLQTYSSSLHSTKHLSLQHKNHKVLQQQWQWLYIHTHTHTHKETLAVSLYLTSQQHRQSRVYCPLEAAVFITAKIQTCWTNTWWFMYL